MIRERKFRARLLMAVCLGGVVSLQGALLTAGAQAQTPGEPPGQKGQSGQAVYAAVCAACHAAGVLEAPKFGDAKAWAPLIKEGQKALTRAAIRGIRQMPPKGGNPSLSNADVERAVVYMANAAGGKFKDPR